MNLLQREDKRTEEKSSSKDKVAEKVKIDQAINSAELIQNVFDIPEELGLKRNINRKEGSTSDIKIELLDETEEKKMRDELLKELMTYMQDENMKIPFQYTDCENVPLTTLMSRLNVLQGESDIIKSARKKESYFYTTVHVLCLVIQLTGVDVKRIAKAQEKNKPIYFKYFRSIAEDESKVEGDENPSFSIVMAAGATLFASVLALVIEKKTGNSSIGDVIEDTASAAFSDTDNQNTDSGNSNPIADLLKGLMG